jgi:UDPglucose 6-dehydrogenase
LVKYAANATLASRISFMNALSGLCERVGPDIKNVAKGIGLDDRIGPRFLQASPGYGGSCFPKDVRSLVDTMESHQLNASLFRAIDQVKRGLAFKPRTDDVREPPALTLIEQLLEVGARVVAYDPEAALNTQLIFPVIEYAHTPYDAARDASAVVVMTEWDVFRTLDLGRVPEDVVRLGFEYATVWPLDPPAESSESSKDGGSLTERLADGEAR